MPKKAAKKPAKAAPKKPAKKATKRPVKKSTKKRGNTNAASVRAQMLADQRDGQVVTLYLQGHRVSVIAERLDMDARQVQKSIARIRQQWRDSKLEDYAEVAQEVKRTAELIKSMAFDAYTRSVEIDHEITTVSVGEEGSNRQHQTKTRPAGDVRFLQLAERCNFRIGQVHGVFDRDKSDLHATEAQKSALVEIIVRTPEEVRNLKSMDYRDLEKIAASRADVIEGEVVR